MFQFLPRGEGKIVGIKAIGKLTDDDYEKAMPILEAVIAEHGAIRLLADLEEFDGWEWRAAWDDVAFGIKHWNDIERMAVIGDKRWEKLCARIADRLMKTDVRQFPTTGKDAAWAWIADGED